MGESSMAIEEEKQLVELGNRFREGLALLPEVFLYAIQVIPQDRGVTGILDPVELPAQRIGVAGNFD